MRQAFSTAAVAGAMLLAISPALPTRAAGSSPAPAATGTPPPQIIRVLSRPICSELHQHVAPAVGMMLENDNEIKQSPDIFKSYNMAAFYGSSDIGGDASDTPPGGDPGTSGLSNPEQKIALLKLENLVSPIANNIIAIQKLLDSPGLINGTGNPEDDKQMQETRDKLLRALAVQNASLDIINGFVDTQGMADLQHADDSTLNSMNQPDTTHAQGTPSPNPMLQNANQAGLPPNPYAIDPAAIPGLALGSNPVTRLIGALHWTITETATRENAAAMAVMKMKADCDTGH
ncbi:MAG TPA: hypothetical protein VMF61_16770 [Candidatus Acidoferrales bacterium]|nr:hypothetical protein [Candidatus Acidoferrales bacterium]